MIEENDRSTNVPQSDDDTRRPRHIRRASDTDKTGPVEVDSSAFFNPVVNRPNTNAAPETDTADSNAAGQSFYPDDIDTERTRFAQPLSEQSLGFDSQDSYDDCDEPEYDSFQSEPSPMPDPPKKPKKPKTSKVGVFMLIIQAILSVAALIQLWRTQMLPTLYLVVLAVLLILVWAAVKRCQSYRKGRGVSVVISLLLCVALGVGCVYAQQGLTALSIITSGVTTGSEANKITKEPFVIYLSGVDNRGELTEDARSDVNILAVVNPTTKRVALINTPRDYYVDLAGTESKDKLTHAGLYGVETSMATLGNLYGITVDHYIRINFAGFISIVDAIGGVDVYSDQAFTSVGSPGYYDPTTFAEGWNHLDGKSALAFARERHAFASGDVQRGINQMKVIDAMLTKLKSPALLTSFTKLMDAASDSFVTSLSQDQISALVRMQLSDFADWDIQSYSVTGTSAKSTKCYSAKGQSLYVMMPDDSSVSEAKTLIASVLGGEDAVADTSQKPEKTDVYTPVADPNAGSAVEETPAESVIIETPAASESVVEEPAETEPSASTEVPAETTPTDGSEQEMPSISLPSQSEVEQAASDLQQAASSIWDVIMSAASSSESGNETANNAANSEAA